MYIDLIGSLTYFSLFGLLFNQSVLMVVLVYKAKRQDSLLAIPGLIAIVLLLLVYIAEVSAPATSRGYAGLGLSVLGPMFLAPASLASFVAWAVTRRFWD